MSDAFYERQRRGGTTFGPLRKTVKTTAEKKPARRLKSEWLKDIDASLGTKVPGLDKCTIDTLTKLLEAINNVKKV